jgi:cytochrome c oxidase assembly protein subunit 15
MSHVHASSVYVLLALTLATAVALRRTSAARYAVLLLGIELLQGTIGFVQYFTDLPVTLVAAHLVGAAVLMAAGTRLVLAVSTADVVAERQASRA